MDRDGQGSAEWLPQVDAMTLEQALDTVRAAWHQRGRGPVEQARWHSIAHSVYFVRRALRLAKLADEAWLRRRLKGLGSSGKEGAA